MKTAPCLLLLFIVPFTAVAQESIQEISKTDADAISNKVNKGVDFGVSLGFNTVFNKLYEARISPLDNKLKITNNSTASFLISTGVSVPLSDGKTRGGRYYRKLDDDGEATGPVYFVPYGWCFIATINLVSFNTAGAGSVYNQKIDGGLGFGYRINDNFQIALTGEMISYRQPRDFLVNDYADKVLLDVAGKPVTSINYDNNDYFVDRYMPSVSLKFFYLIAYKPVK